MKHLKRRNRRGLVTKRIVYRNRRHAHDRSQEMKVNIRRGETLDPDYAAAMVAVRASIPLNNVKILEIVDVNPK